MKDLKLGTGYFAGKEGARRNASIRAELVEELNAKELEFLGEIVKRNLQLEKTLKNKIKSRFFVAFNQDDFDLSEFVDQTVETEDGNTISKYK